MYKDGKVAASGKGLKTGRVFYVANFGFKIAQDLIQQSNSNPHTPQKAKQSLQFDTILIQFWVLQLLEKKQVRWKGLIKVTRN